MLRFEIGRQVSSVLEHWRLEHWKTLEDNIGSSEPWLGWEEEDWKTDEM